MFTIPKCPSCSSSTKWVKDLLIGPGFQRECEQCGIEFRYSWTTQGTGLASGLAIGIAVLSAIAHKAELFWGSFALALLLLIGTSLSVLLTKLVEIPKRTKNPMQKTFRSLSVWQTAVCIVVVLAIISNLTIWLVVGRETKSVSRIRQVLETRKIDIPYKTIAEHESEILISAMDLFERIITMNIFYLGVILAMLIWHYLYCKNKRKYKRE